MRTVSAMAAMLAVAAVATTAMAASQHKTPYWGSISAGQARMRSGPGRNYPADWLYQRQDLPVRVIEVYPGWRKVQDPDGAQGWMIGNLVSDQRTAMVKGGVAELRSAPDVTASIVWRAQPGVIGRVSHCGDGWCKIDVKGRGGFIETQRLWGVDANEKLD